MRRLVSLKTYPNADLQEENHHEAQLQIFLRTTLINLNQRENGNKMGKQEDLTSEKQVGDKRRGVISSKGQHGC